MSTFGLFLTLVFTSLILGLYNRIPLTQPGRNILDAVVIVVVGFLLFVGRIVVER